MRKNIRTINWRISNMVLYKETVAPLYLSSLILFHEWFYSKDFIGKKSFKLYWSVQLATYIAWTINVTFYYHNKSQSIVFYVCFLIIDFFASSLVCSSCKATTNRLWKRLGLRDQRRDPGCRQCWRPCQSLTQWQSVNIIKI